MTLALDTNVVIDVMRGRRPSVREHYALALIQERSLVASLVVFHELHYGIAVSVDGLAEARAVEIVLRRIPIEPLTEQDMITAAEVQARLKRSGRPIGSYDALIAGQALARGWTLVTSNSREFERVDGLSLETWAV